MSQMALWGERHQRGFEGPCLAGKQMLFGWEADGGNQAWDQAELEARVALSKSVTISELQQWF